MTTQQATPKREFQRSLRRWLLALRWRRALQGLFRGALLSGGIVLLLALIARLTVFKTLADLRSLALQLTGWVMLLNIVGHFAFTPPIQKRLREVDRRADLREALTTWHEIRTDTIPANASWEALLHDQIVTTLRTKKASRVLRWLPTTKQLVALGTLTGLTLLSLWLPNPQDARVILRELEEQALTQAEEHVEESIHTAESLDTLTEEERAALLEALQEALDALEAQGNQPGLDEEQAALLKALAELQQFYDLESAEQIAQLSDVAEQLSSESNTLQDMLDALGAEDMQAAIDAMEALQNDSMSEEESQQAAETLEQLAEAVSDESLSEALEDLAEALESMDAEAQQQALEELQEQLGELAESQQGNGELGDAQQSLEQALQALDAMNNPASGGGNPFASAGENPSNGNDVTGPGGNNSHSEDRGADNPYGDEEHERIEDIGGIVTLPRGETEGDPRLTEGRDSDAGVPYGEVVGEYSDAAQAQLDSGSYPPAMQSFIEAYFTDLGE